MPKQPDITLPTLENAETVDAPYVGDFPLPDFTRSDPASDSLSYCDVSPEDLQTYIDSLCRLGFSYVGSDWVKYLFGGGVLVTLWDSTDADGQCSLHIENERKTTGGVTADALKPLLARSDFFGSVFAMEQTPDRLYDALGAQRFLALLPVSDGSSEYYVRSFLVARNGALALSGGEWICTDADADGRTEFVELCSGPTSGIDSLRLTAYEITDGTPVADGTTVIVPEDRKQYTLTEENGKIFLQSSDQTSRHSATLSGGLFQVEGMTLSGGNFYQYLPTDMGLDLYVWQTDEEFFCGLLPSTVRARFDGELNALHPVTLEEMRLILTQYPIRPYLSFIDHISGDPVTFTEDQKKEIQQRLFG